MPNAPKLDNDAMQKDRMALLVHPEDDATLFVAGNAGALSYRVQWKEGVWTESAYDDTADGSGPHVSHGLTHQLGRAHDDSAI